MTPHTQTILHDPITGSMGDCWRTSIACLLDLPPQEVPHFALKGAREFLAATQEWLRRRGLALTDFDANAISDGYHLLVGPSPRNPQTVLHCVVGLDGRIAWDPHPSRAGLHGDSSNWHTAYIVRNDQASDIGHGTADPIRPATHGAAGNTR